MNKCIFIGTVTRDLAEFSKGFGINLKCNNGFVRKDGEESFTYINCVCFNERFFVDCHRLKQGSKVCVETQANVRKRENNGTTFYETSFLIDKMEVLDTPQVNQQNV